MLVYDFFGDAVAEYMLNFVELPQNWAVFICSCDSAAEFCLNHFEEFKTFLENTFGCSVALPFVSKRRLSGSVV